MAQSISRIAVIGFGSAGAAASIQLVREGFDVEVFERASAIGPSGAGILVHPSGQMVLERLGVLDEVASRSERIERLHARTRTGKTILDIRYDERSEGRAAYGVERSVLFEALEKAATAAGVKFHLGTEIVKLQQDAAGARCIANNGESFGDYDLLLLCDGARSQLRNSVVSRSYLWNYRYGARWAIGRCSAVKGALHQVIHGTKYLIGILPTGGGRASFFWGTSPGDREIEFSRWRETAIDFCPEAAELLSPLRGYHDLIETKYFHLFSPPCRQPETLLLGDAWHAMSPHLGQGTNLALLDGYVFAKTLAGYDGKLDLAAPEFLSQRRGNNRVYSVLSFAFSPFFQSGGVIKGVLRDTFLPLIGSVPWIRGHMLVSISGLKHQFLRRGELDLGDPH